MPPPERLTPKSRQSEKTYRVRQLPSRLAHHGQVATLLADLVDGLLPEHVRVFSLAASLNTLELPPTKVATIMFNRLPPMFDNEDNEWSVPGKSAGLMRDIILDVHFRDFTPLNDVCRDDHVVDCIAISGLASHPFGSWKQRSVSSSFMWLRDRLPRDMLNARSIIYGYDTTLVGSESVQEIGDIAIAFKGADGRWRRDGSPDLLVNKDSAIQQCSKFALSIDEDHSHPVKFRADDPDCQVLIEYMCDVAQEVKESMLLLDDAEEESEIEKEQADIFGMIYSLELEETGHRLREIQSQYSSTFEWIFNDESLGFSSWLRDSRGIYWIQGKPGCGKSTLMKLARDDARTRAVFSEVDTMSRLHLPGAQGKEPRGRSGVSESPPGDDGLPSQTIPHQSYPEIPETQEPFEGSRPADFEPPLITSSPQFLIIDFFFHDRGSYVQKSLEGLLHRVLPQMMRGCTDLAKLLLPHFLDRPKAKRNVWSLDDLREFLDLVLSQSEIDLRILFFMDALDEFEGEPLTIATLVRDLVTKRAGSRTEVKVCCASRPWNAFQDAFRDVTTCKVHEHTALDIQMYVQGRLQSNERMQSMMDCTGAEGESILQQLGQDISSRAEGVFIWVRIVLDELLQAFMDGATSAELLDILDSFPDDLDRSYQRLIDRIPKKYRSDGYILIEIVLRSKDSLGLRDLGIALQCARAKSVVDAIRHLPEDPYSGHYHEVMKRRLQSRCGGLLEVLDDTTVQFMHQTAKEFLSRSSVSAGILRHDPRRARFNGYSFLTKFWLTLAHASGSKFDWKAYILSMYSMKAGYVVEPHYKAASGVHIKYPAWIHRARNSADGCLAYHVKAAGFAAETSQERCLVYALLSELSTGLSQYTFLESIPADTIRSFFHIHNVTEDKVHGTDPGTRKGTPDSGDVIVDHESSAKRAKLLLYMDDMDEAAESRYENRRPDHASRRQPSDHEETGDYTSYDYYESTNPPHRDPRPDPPRYDPYAPYGQTYHDPYPPMPSTWGQSRPHASQDWRDYQPRWYSPPSDRRQDQWQYY
ncbi:Hypothetical protein D9617_20g028230 [Elsinoe fawcettii]|nr:Hypothetical protein D9617_20g028230 [Elsinoe fawcettii]